MKAADPDKRRIIILEYCACIVKDLPYIIMFLVIIASVFMGIRMRKQIRRK